MPGAVLPSHDADPRPNATVVQGMGVTHTARKAAAPVPAASAAATRQGTGRGAANSKGKWATSAAAAASPISTRSAPAVPMRGMNSRLKRSAPAMPPIVFAA